MKRTLAIILIACAITALPGCAAPSEVSNAAPPEESTAIPDDVAPDILTGHDVSMVLSPADLGQSTEETIDGMLGVGAKEAYEKDGNVYVVFDRPTYDAFLQDFRVEMDKAADELKSKHSGIERITFADDYRSFEIISDGMEGKDAFILNVYCAYYAEYAKAK